MKMTEEQWHTVDDLPFDDSVSVHTWDFGHGNRIQIESGQNGYFVSGRVNGKDWHDDDHEDFHLATSDDLLDFLRHHGLLSILSAKDT